MALQRPRVAGTSMVLRRGLERGAVRLISADDEQGITVPPVGNDALLQHLIASCKGLCRVTFRAGVTIVPARSTPSR
jgi:hypothetical protein